MLKELHQKLEELNREHNENWMILIDSTRFNYVFIIDSEDINKFPKWWPQVDVAETIESVLGLVPLKRYVVTTHNDTQPIRYELNEKQFGKICKVLLETYEDV